MAARTPPTADAAHRLLRILHTGILMILIIFGVVAWIVTRGADTTRQGAPTWQSMSPVIYALAGFSILIFAMIPIIRGKLLPRVPSDFRISGGQQAIDRARAGLVSRWVTGNVFTWALCGSVGVYGLVASLMMRQPWPYLLFAAPTAAALVYFRPRIEPLREMLSMINRR
jgi:hypothetical protein